VWFSVLFYLVGSRLVTPLYWINWTGFYAFSTKCSNTFALLLACRGWNVIAFKSYILFLGCSWISRYLEFHCSIKILSNFTFNIIHRFWHIFSMILNIQWISFTEMIWLLESLNLFFKQKICAIFVVELGIQISNSFRAMPYYSIFFRSIDLMVSSPACS
jgi:hypothetical protein